MSIRIVPVPSRAREGNYMSTDERWTEIQQQKAQWSDKLVASRKLHGHAHFYRTIEILAGNPSDDVLINRADNWSWNFGGVVRRYTAENGKKMANVKVYTD